VEVEASKIWKCYITSDSFLKNGVIIGFGWNVVRKDEPYSDPLTGSSQLVRLNFQPFLEPLSYQAFTSGTCCRSSSGSELKYFLPICICSSHIEGMSSLSEQCCSLIYSGKPDGFTLEIGVRVITAAMDSIISAWISGKLDNPKRVFLGYCACHRLLLLLRDKDPHRFRKSVVSRVKRFIRGDSASKRHLEIPDFGYFLQSLTAMKFGWKKHSFLLLQEFLATTVHEVLKRYPELKQEESNTIVDETRIEKHFSVVRRDLIVFLFNYILVSQVSAKTSEEYDESFGLVSDAFIQKFSNTLNGIKMIKDFGKVFEILDIPQPKHERMIEILIESVVIARTAKPTSEIFDTPSNTLERRDFDDATAAEAAAGSLEKDEVAARAETVPSPSAPSGKKGKNTGDKSSGSLYLSNAFDKKSTEKGRKRRKSVDSNDDDEANLEKNRMDACQMFDPETETHTLSIVTSPPEQWKGEKYLRKPLDDTNSVKESKAQSSFASMKKNESVAELEKDRKKQSEPEVNVLEESQSDDAISQASEAAQDPEAISQQQQQLNNAFETDEVADKEKEQEQEQVMEQNDEVGVHSDHLKKQT